MDSAHISSKDDHSRSHKWFLVAPSSWLRAPEVSRLVASAGAMGEGGGWGRCRPELPFFFVMWTKSKGCGVWFSPVIVLTRVTTWVSLFLFLTERFQEVMLKVRTLPNARRVFSDDDRLVAPHPAFGPQLVSLTRANRDTANDILWVWTGVLSCAGRRESENQSDSSSFHARGHTRAQLTREELIQFT